MKRITILPAYSLGSIATLIQLSGIEKYYGQTMRDEATLIVIYQKDKKKYVSSLDLVNKTVISTNELPDLGQDVE